MSPHQERPTFQWVFQETESSQKLHNNKLNTLWQNNGTKCPSAHQYESVENHSEGETENETSATCYDLALPSRIANNYAEKTEMASSSIPTSTNKNTTTSTSSIFLTEEPHSNCNIFRWKLDSVSPSRCKPRIALWENSTAILSLAQQDQTRCLSSAAFSLPMDSDSLINLSYLELLARQWRFYCQHKVRKSLVLISWTLI